MNNSYNGHLCIVFALEHYNPLNMIRALGENGINPVYISVKRRYEVATKSKYISELHRVDSVEDGYQLLMEQYGHLAEETGKPLEQIQIDTERDNFMTAAEAAEYGLIDKVISKR